MTQTMFRRQVAFWLASYALSDDLLSHPRLRLPLANRDPVWVFEELIRNGNAAYKQLSDDKAGHAAEKEKTEDY